MSFIFSAAYEYKEGNYQLDIQEAVARFPFIAEKTIYGEVLAANLDSKVVVIREAFQCTAKKEGRWYAVVGDLNPLRDRGIPPCQLCLALYKYRDQTPAQSRQFPIMEDETVKGSAYSFDDIVRRVTKEQEIALILASTTFHPQMVSLAQLLRDAQIAFEEERCPDTKTSCRKILEFLRAKSKNWQTIDNSKSICEKLCKMMDSLYSLASVGGPHEGLNTKDETQLILKSVSAVFFYVNTLLKSSRVEIAPATTAISQKEEV